MPLKSKRKQHRGFALIDLIIGMIIFTIIFVIALYNLLETPESRQIRIPAIRNLRTFSHGNKLNALKCEGQDKDKNGLVLCRAKDRQGQTVSLQCGYDQRHPYCTTQAIGNRE
ncbi:MAG: prepilin-type N-terminal cleavage/methylation domain-containing protein [cyanobacterium endosymbiont of Rhopalodia sterrenbergii]